MWSGGVGCDGCWEVDGGFCEQMKKVHHRDTKDTENLAAARRPQRNDENPDDETTSLTTRSVSRKEATHPSTIIKFL